MHDGNTDHRDEHNDANTPSDAGSPTVAAVTPEPQAQNEPKPPTRRSTRRRGASHTSKATRSRTTTRRRKTAPAPLPRLTPAQQELAAEHLGLVGLHLRTRVPTPPMPTRDREREDLFQEGCIALFRAAARYNPREHGTFPSFALPRIRGAVFAAIHERFTTLRVPLREASKARTVDPADAPPVMLPLDNHAEFHAIRTLATDSADGDNIRHAVRRRTERAIRLALRDIAKQPWRARNPIDIMKRLADERLLISDEHQRTSLRSIARDVGISSSRVCAYETRLTKAVSDHLAHDVQVALLFEFAQQAEAGFLAPMTLDYRRQLIDVELDAFDGRFARLDRARQSEMVYRMLEQSSPLVPEVARNLYRLTLCDDFDIAAVA